MQISKAMARKLLQAPQGTVVLFNRGKPTSKSCAIENSTSMRGVYIEIVQYGFVDEEHCLMHFCRDCNHIEIWVYYLHDSEKRWKLPEDNGNSSDETPVPVTRG